jgi:hypothetical protein
MFPLFTTYAPTDYTTHISKPSDSKKPQLSKSLQFIMDNREELELEVAKGEGERVDTLVMLYKEISEKDKEAWKLMLQENYAKIFQPDGLVASDEYVDYMLRTLPLPVN